MTRKNNESSESGFNYLNQVGCVIINSVRKQCAITLSDIAEALGEPEDIVQKKLYGIKRNSWEPEQLLEIYKVVGEDGRLDFLRRSGSLEGEIDEGVYFGKFRGFYPDAEFEGVIGIVAKKYGRLQIRGKAYVLDELASVSVDFSNQYDVSYRNEYSYFGQAIHDFRKQASLSQRQLAIIADISQRTVSYIEDGKRVSSKNASKNKTALLNAFKICPSEKLEVIMGLPVEKTASIKILASPK